MSTIVCPKCKTDLPGDLFNSPEMVECYSCQQEMQVLVFPALFRQIVSGKAGEAALVDSEATCFYHPQKKAAVPCDACGRFLCSLCDVELNERHVCPKCLDAGAKKGKLKNLQNRRLLFDSIALSLAIMPILIFYLTFITAPVSLYYVIRYWNTPISIVARTKVRFVVAGILAMCQIIAWLAVIGYFFF